MQRQKLAIARAVLKRPEVLVLDEATASLDEASQSQIMDKLFEEFRGRSLFWVLHRPALAERFDQVIVLDEGRVGEHGSYAELMASEGLLFRLSAAG